MNIDIIILLFKEWKESIRTSRLLIWVVVCMFFGILSPLTAYFLPDILTYVGATQNVLISVGNITYNDALEQYIKNFTQIGTLVIIIIHMGRVSSEKMDGTIQFLFSRPISRFSLLTAKIGALKIEVCIGQVMAMICMALYSIYLFPDFPIGKFVIANIFLYIYFLTIGVITISFSALVKRPVLAAVGAIAVWLGGSIFGVVDSLGDYSFTKAGEQVVQIVEGFPVQWKPSIGAIVLMVCMVTIAWLRFSRWEPSN